MTPRRLLLVAATVAGCHRERHETEGALSSVESPVIILSAAEHRPTLTVSNDDGSGGCLRLQGLQATIDGEVQVLSFVGGSAASGGCAPATFGVHVADDPTRSVDVIEVRDDTRSLSARFPNVLSGANWRVRPPSHLRPGETFVVAVAPPPARGVTSLRNPS